MDDIAVSGEIKMLDKGGVFDFAMAQLETLEPRCISWPFEDIDEAIVRAHSQHGPIGR